jgi:hypothetical protein
MSEALLLKKEEVRAEAIRLFKEPFTGLIDPDELLFSIPEPERAAAVVYEYGRESMTIRHYAEKRRVSPKFVPQANTWQRSCALLATAKNLFPHLPWKKLSDETRRNFTELSERFWTEWDRTLKGKHPWRAYVDNAFLISADELRTEADSIPGAIYGTFLIDPRFPKSQVIDAFATFLSQFSNRFTRRERRGRKIANADLLVALSYLRLRYHCSSYRQAADTERAVSGRNSGSKEKRTFNQGCRRAVKHFQEYFGLEELPLRYTDDWEK